VDLTSHKTIPHLKYEKYNDFLYFGNLTEETIKSVFQTAVVLFETLTVRVKRRLVQTMFPDL